MKKIICLIIVLSSLLLVSCAVASPAESTEISWKTSIISTTASAQEATTAAGTAATAGTNSTTATTAATTATSSASGGAVPVESFKPSGYAQRGTGNVETRSKIIFTGYTGNHFNVGTVYYSKADGEMYAFCFDPFCDHKYSFQSESKCIAQMTSSHNRATLEAGMYYLNSRIYFVYLGSIYSCSEFATDLRLELELEHFDSIDDYNKRQKRGGSSLLFKNLTGYGNYLFFNYVDPDGTVCWYRYDVVKRQKKRMDDDLHALEEKLGLKLMLNGIINNYIYLYAYDDAGKFVCGYVCDYDLKNEIPTEEKSDAWQLFYTDEGIYCRDYTPYKNTGMPETTYDIILVKTDGTVKTVVKDMFYTFEGKYSFPVYLSEDYMYYINSKSVRIGYEYSLQKANGLANYVLDDCNTYADGKLYRYNMKTGKKDIVFNGVLEDFYEIESVEYLNRDERVALLYSQTWVKTDEIYKGEYVYKFTNMTLKCHLDENGIVDSFEILDME